MNHSHEVRIEAVLTATDEVRSLVGELKSVLSAEYPPEQRHGLSLDAIIQPHVRFLLARLRGAAVGCGGIALLPVNCIWRGDGFRKELNPSCELWLSPSFHPFIDPGREVGR